MTCHRDGVDYCQHFGGEDTPGHNLCLVRIPDDADLGELESRGCDVGCWSCLDYPQAMALHAASHSWSMYGGSSWMLSTTWDARGWLHTLESNKPRLVDSVNRYRRGACVNNDGRACLGEEDIPCTCHPEPPTFIEPGQAHCPDGSAPGMPILQGAFFGDGIFYAGRWPPDGHGIYGGSNDRDMQCRRYWDAPTIGVLGHSQNGNTIFLRDSVDHNACTCDWLVIGAGYVVSSSCLSGYANGWITQAGQQAVVHHDHLYEQYMHSCDSSCTGVYAQVMFAPEVSFYGNDPTIDPRVTAIKNTVLEKIRDNEFSGIMGSVRFDRLDHEAPQQSPGARNARLGKFSREWDMRELGIHDQRLPVVATFDYGKTRLYGEPVEAELVIVRVKCELDLQLYHAKAKMTTGFFSRYDTVAPHSVVRIRAWLGLRIKSIGPMSTAEYTSGNIAHWPTITPDRNWVQLAETEGEFYEPPANVDWWGHLNDFSVPSLRDQGYKLDLDNDDEYPWSFGRFVTDDIIGLGIGGATKAAATACDTWEVPARQALVDTALEGDVTDGFTYWQGKADVTFIGTPGYDDCLGGRHAAA